MRLLEREEHLAEFGALLDRARAGHGGMIIVNGESGAGKTSLLRAFTDEHVDDAPVLWSACDPLSTPRPLGPVHDLADQLGDDVASMLENAVQPHEIFQAVFEHLRVHPSVLVVDDLHWADQGTIDLLRYVLRRIGVTSSIVIGALRDDEIGPDHRLLALLGDVARSPDGTSTTLRPLSTEAIGTMVEGRSVDPVWLRAVTAGNPFFVVEMIDYEGGEIPRTVRDAVLARTTGLTAGTWDLLHLLACAPEAIGDRLLVPLGIGLEPLRMAGDAGLIQRAPRGVEFRHDLCRMAITSTIPPGGEAGFHRRLLDALEQFTIAEPAVLAHHAVHAGDAIRTLRYASEAGRVATRSGAHTQAAAFFETALQDGAPVGPIEETDLLELLADEYYLIDRLDDAIAASERAMRLRQREGNVAGVSFNHHALAVFHWYNADRDLAVQHARASVAVFEPGVGGHSDAERVRLGHGLAIQAYLAIQANDIDLARGRLGRAAEAGADLDQALTVRIGLMNGICDLLDGRANARESTLSILDGASEHLDEIYSSGFSNLTYVDVEQRRLRDATELLGFTLPLTVERDLPICQVWQLGARGRLNMLKGDWAQALHDADRVLSAPSAPLARTWPYLLRGLIRLRSGGDAAEALDAAWRLARRFDEPMRLLPAAAALVEQAWLTGRPDERIEECYGLLQHTKGIGLEWGRGDLAGWLHRLDPTGGFEETDEIAEPYRLQIVGDSVGAAEMWDALGAPYERALALIDTGELDAMRSGLDLLDRLGADEVSAKIRQDLRRGGMLGVPSRRRESTRENPAGMTNRQVEILRLLADGSTNAEIASRLFVSTKTVDHHVSALLAKLQVANRRDAVRRGTELGIVD